nr:MAG TPA: hypothetical protein [Caudoviricetes sp.]
MQTGLPAFASSKLKGFMICYFYCCYLIVLQK